MKKMLFFGTLALLTTAGSALAADQTPTWDESRLFGFDFQCEFGVPTGPTPPPAGVAQSVPGSSSRPNCAAVARVFANVRDKSLDTQINPEWTKANLLAVACNNTLIYANGANLESKERVVEIEGLGPHAPEIVVKRYYDEPSLEWMRYEAFLKVAGERIPGYCNVRAAPVHHETTQPAPQPLR